jgi:hypothetical protein
MYKHANLIQRFQVEWKKVTRLCTTKQLLMVNGQYPGPTIAVHEGDNVEIKVKNRIAQNTTLHWWVWMHPSLIHIFQYPYKQLFFNYMLRVALYAVMLSSFWLQQMLLSLKKQRLFERMVIFIFDFFLKK